ncbi:pyridoxal 5'-phosphate synthase, glutaminase subunit Pdx2 [Paracoccidioides brasiliensis]|uniref:glutaminase n=1 Tax=Paracoccidioides brasiliensis TaxID=121759 RepID=A0A1D2JMZ7_PARBR|nr:pyridoxal 5'-phosphate synthase, glutaminase subunit Pdx2 [Paracoccidioides brasiliensis]ODH48201.1 pyridoxal 5'-phosphate synthase, glutaminase subunit Pdx2 [Paracoccidioides brasiliensis]
MTLTVGVLALQGAFYEHLKLLHKAATTLSPDDPKKWKFIEVRTPAQLDSCDGLIIPGGESTTISLVAARSQLLDPLRDFVKLHRRPTWGTCAGLILLAESANRTKKGGQELIGGLDVRVNRNHFGRQAESFQAPVNLPFLSEVCQEARNGSSPASFMGVFIRAPVVEKLLSFEDGVQVEEQRREGTVVAPSRQTEDPAALKVMSNHVDVLAKLPGRATRLTGAGVDIEAEADAGDIVAVKQGNVFGTSFHPELTDDPRIHIWWLRQVENAVLKSWDPEK